MRAEAQRARFNLPAWPTTTIGSFPQTTEIRGLRTDFKRAIWMRITTAPALRNTSNRRSSSRNVWVWTCWCTARPSVTIWWNTSVNTGRLCLYPERLGAKLRLPLREAAGGDRRRQPPGSDHRGVGEVCPVSDRQTGKRHADGAGDHSLLVVPA